MLEIDIPRNKMPQIFEADLVNDYQIEYGMAAVADIVPVQSQRLAGIVEKAAAALAANAHPHGPIIVDKYKRIINGHHRYDAYQLLGIDIVPVMIVKDAEIFELIERYSNKVSYAEVL